MRQGTWGDGRRHDTAKVGGEKRKSFSGPTVQTPAAGSGENWVEEEEKKAGGKGKREKRGDIPSINTAVCVCACGCV